MIALQEQFERDFPDKSVKEIDASNKYLNFTNHDLDLREYENLEILYWDYNNLTSIDLSGCKRLRELYLGIIPLAGFPPLANARMISPMDNLASINLSECKKLKYLNLASNRLTSINLSNQKELNNLCLESNSLISIDLSRHNELKKIELKDSHQLTSLNLSGCKELRKIKLAKNKLVSVDFLNYLPNPEKLEELLIYDNNIQPTTLDFLRPFVNLKSCKLGEDLSKDKEKLEERLQAGTYNKFYGSLEPIKNLTKLEKFCIAGTDVEEGIEYIPSKIAWLSKGKSEKAMELNLIDCQPLREGAKVAKIKNELRLFNYDIEAWQLAHPELMLKARPEYFTDPDSKEEWINALTNKITQTQQELTETKTNLPDKLKRIQRLTSKLASLENIKDLLTQRESLENQVQEEREIHQDSLRAMDNFYQQNPPSEEQRLNNILKVFEPDYLKTNSENKQKDQEIKELKEEIKTIKQIAEQRIQELENKISQLENHQEQQTETRTENIFINTNN